MNEQEFIPFHRPCMGSEEIEEVEAVLRSGWLTSGPRTAQFEQEFRVFTAAPHALAVNSGTAAMHLALAGLDIGPGDEVITTPLTFCATVNCILHVGATPILADIGPDGNIDPECVREKISDRTRALLPVHYAGLPCDMDSLWKLAADWNLAVVEDAAHALGAYYQGHPIGAGNPAAGRFSDAVAFSFYATKNLSIGEGGMVTSHKQTLAERMKVLCLHGINKDAWNRYSETGKWYYEVVECGFKYNLSDVQSAIGLPQLRKQKQFLALRTAYAQLYNDAFGDMEEVEIPSEPSGRRHAWHLYVLKLNLDTIDITRAEFIEELRQQGVGASVHFIPIPKHPYFEAAGQLPVNHCPKALDMYPRLVSLPLYPGLTAQQLERVVASVKTVLHRAKKRVLVAARG